jgi:hypothetical protein
MPTCVARGPEFEIEIPSKIVAIPSQSREEGRSSRYIGQKTMDATRHTESIRWSLSPKPANSKHPDTEFALRIAGGAGSRPANSINCSTKPQGRSLRSGF